MSGGTRFARSVRLSFLAAALATSACGPGAARAPERVAPARGALESVALSAAFELEDAPELTGLPYLASTHTVCGPSVCLLATNASRSYGATLVVERVSFAGEPLDDAKLHLDGESVQVLAPLGDDFLLLTEGPTVAHVRRISGDDPTDATELSTRIPGHPFALASDGPTLLLGYEFEGIRSTQLYDAATLATIGSPVTLGYDPNRIVAGDGQYLVYGPRMFRRVSATTGAALDAADVDYNRYLLPTSTEATFVGDGYVIGFLATPRGSSFPGSVYAVRVPASGPPVDQDDTFNELSGARSVCTDCARKMTTGSAGVLDVATSGDDALFLFTGDDGWGMTPKRMVSRFDPASGTTRHGSTTSPELTLPRLGAPSEITLALHGAEGFLVEVTTETSARVAPVTIASSAPVLALDAGVSVVGEGSRRTRPEVASNGTDFLVTWLVDGHLRATRVDGDTGDYLDTPPLDLGASARAVVASDGVDYFVFSLEWEQYDPYVDLHYRVVRADGTLEDDVAIVGFASDPVPSDAFLALERLGLAWSGEYYLATWRQGSGLFGRRFDADGTMVDASDLGLDYSSYGRVATTADRPADVTTASFLTAYGSNGRPWLRRVRSHLGTVVSTVTPLDGVPSVGFQQINGGASDGSSHVFAWTQDGRHRIARFDAVSGDRVGSIVDYGMTTSPPSGAGLHWNGRSYLATHAGPVGAAILLTLHRFDPATLAPRDAAFGDLGQVVVPVSVEGDDGHYEFALASSSAGRSLLVTTEPSAERETLRIVGRFLVDDGTASTNPAAADAGVDAGDATGEGDAGVDASTEDAGPAEVDASMADSGPSAVDASAPAADASTDDTPGGGGCGVAAHGARDDLTTLVFAAGIALFAVRRRARSTRATA